MGLFGKKNKATKNQDDRDLIAQNASAIDTLLVMTSNANLKDELKMLQEQIKYITPLPEDKAYNLDKKIRNAIDDLKIELVKEKDAEKSSAKADNLIRDLKIAIVERKGLI